MIWHWLTLTTSWHRTQPFLVERTTQTQANAHVTDLASECLDYLDSRAEFWQQQQPTYSREQERRNRTKGQDAATPHQKKDAKKKEDPTKWIIENLCCETIFFLGKPEDTAKITSYKVTVKISDIANAGTDSDLEVEIFGQKGNTGRQKLTVSETNTRKHDKGQSDTFTLVAKDVGEISKIRVAQTSELPGLGCHIAEISVKSSGSAVPTVFHCYSWFDKAHDDGLTEREFAPAVTASEDIAKDGTAKEKNEQAKNR